MNKKIANATEIVIDGIRYRSKLEGKAAQILKENNISFSYEPFKIEYIPKFEYNGQKFRAAQYSPDFVVDDTYILEIKGFPNDVWRYKKKLILLSLLHDKRYSRYKFYEIKTIKELNNWINEYKEKSL